MLQKISRQWVALALGFFLVLLAICGSGYYLLIRSTSESISEIGSDLAFQLSRTASSTVNVTDLEKIVSPDDFHSPAFERSSHFLRSYLTSHPEIRSIQTVRMVDGVPLTVVRADGIEEIEGDQKRPFSVFGERHPGIRAALLGGTDTTSHVIIDSKDGPFQWATAPIFDARGSRVGVLYLERDASDLVRTSRFSSDQWVWLVLLGLLGSALCATLVTWMVRAGFKNEIERYSMVRILIVSGAFLVLSMSVVLGGGYSILMKHALNQTLNDSLKSSEIIHSEMKKALEPGIGSQERESLVLEIRKAGRTLEAGARTVIGDDLESITRYLLAAEEAEQRLRDSLLKRIQPYDLNLAICSVLAFFATIAALGFVRSSSAHSQRISVLASESEFLHTQQEQIVENLSIGFFSFRANRVDYASEAWKVLFGQRDDESYQSVLERSLHPSEAQAFLSLLHEAERDAKAFSTTVRIGHNNADARYIEVLGGPIFLTSGEFDCLIGSTSDVTAREEARLLEAEHRRQIEEANERLREAFAELEENFEATVYSLVKAVEAKDFYTAGHSERVMELCLLIGERLGLGQNQIRVLRLGALVHDIGKIGIPDSILTKNAGLTDEEYGIMKQHPELGMEMIERIPTFRDCIPIVLYHHERLNGRGYPYRLTGDKIPLLARICAVADCFDAMTSNRAYRKGLPLSVALAELRKDAADGALDPEIVRILADMMEESALKTVA